MTELDKIKMLEMLADRARKRAECAPKYMLSVFSTDSEEISTVFRDFYQKLNELEPMRHGPIPFDTILSLAGKYVSALIQGSYTGDTKLLGSDTAEPHISAYVNGAEWAKKFYLGNDPFAIHGYINNHYIKRGIYIQVEKSESFAELISALRKINNLKFNTSIVENNIVEHLISITDGGSIFAPESFANLMNFGKGDLVICCPSKSENSVVKALMQMNLRFRKAGTISKNGNIKFVSPYGSFSLHHIHLKSIMSSRYGQLVSVDVSKDIAESDPAFIFEDVTPCETVEDEAPITHDCYISAASVKSDPNVSPYKSGMSQIISAATAAIASGERRDSISLSTEIKYRKSDSPSSLLAHLLGIYRAQIELCASSYNDRIKICEDIDSPISRTCTVIKIRSANAEGKSVFIVRPECDKNFPEFKNIRKTFSYVEELLQSDRTSSALPLNEKNSELLGADLSSKCSEVGAFVIYTNAELLPADGVITEKIR
ncbi:MAG: hypothetical protein U0M06_02525 [Clostridia bacterium]|nr:hypothetical protein [Clostridia bacterium]